MRDWTLYQKIEDIELKVSITYMYNMHKFVFMFFSSICLPVLWIHINCIANLLALIMQLTVIVYIVTIAHVFGECMQLGEICN